MHITFGLGLDAHQGPSANAVFDAPAVGPKGFLSLLETYLGLAAPGVDPTMRIARYLEALREAQTGVRRFYSASFDVDPAGTATQLLEWRDEWRMGGWHGEAIRDGDTSASCPQRIRDLAEVETIARMLLPPGEAERLEAVEKALTASGPGPIVSVALADPLEDFARAWKQVLALLPGVAEKPPVPQGNATLRAVQELALQAQLSGEAPRAALAPCGDGSLVVVRAAHVTVAQQWLASRHAGSPRDRLVVAEEGGEDLDAALRAAGVAACGFDAPTPLRQSLQALGLALAVAWAPRDVEALVDFLDHPVGPLGLQTRRRLAQAVRSEAGIGGQAWRKAKEDLLAAASRDGAGDDEDARSDAGEGARSSASRLGEEIEFWLERSRWSRDEGAPVQEVHERIRRLSASLQRRAMAIAEEDPAGRTALLGAVRQCAGVLEAVAEFQRQGRVQLSVRELDQIVAVAGAVGSGDPDAGPQVGCMRSARAVAACIEPADEVVWWMPAAPGLPRRLPWSVAEVTQLRSLGVEIRDPRREARSLALRSLRPLLMARQCLVLVLPPSDAEVHPVRQLLGWLVQGLEESVIDLDASLADPRSGTPREEVSRLPLPERPELITLPGSVALARGRPSFSAMDALFNNPARYVLQRSASLQAMQRTEVQETHRLKGVLFHRFVEKLFSHGDALGWSDDRLAEWFQGCAAELLEQEGAVFLMLGSGMSRQRFLSICKRSVTKLLAHLRSAGALRVRAELPVEGGFERNTDPLLAGKVDLVVDLPAKARAVLDCKWGSAKSHSDALAKGDCLQLGLYAHLLQQMEGASITAVGYFIVSTGDLYVSEEGVFPQARVRRPREGLNLPNLIRQARATFDWRAGQLSRGEVAVVPEAAKGEFDGPDGTLPVKGGKSWEEEFLVTLGGWE
jgi:hypothetical protein